jgi:uncharacterized membrane protein YczE
MYRYFVGLFVSSVSVYVMRRSKEFSAIATLLLVGVFVYSFMFLMTTNDSFSNSIISFFIWVSNINVLYLLIGGAGSVVVIYLLVYNYLHKV